MLGLAFRQAQGSEYSRGLRVDPERRFFTPPSKAGLGATEWVNLCRDFQGWQGLSKAEPKVSSHSFKSYK